MEPATTERQEPTQGMNVVVVAGNVGTITFDETRNRGDDACSFTIAIDKTRLTTWVRVNVYGPLVTSCRGRLRKGVRVEVVGELMNRRRDASDGMMFTEVRCARLIFT